MARKTRIGLLINSICSNYSASIIEGISRYCQEHNCVQFVFPIVRGSNVYHYNYQCDSVKKFILQNNIDILIISSASISNNRSREELLEDLKDLPSMIKVSVGIKLDGIPSIVVDDKSALKELLNHVINVHNRKKFLFLKASSNCEEVLSREKVFKQVLKENNLDINLENELLGNFILRNSYVACEQYLKTHTKDDFNAVFCINDESALGCISCLEDHGIHVPEDVSVVGYDNSSFSLSYDISLSTVDQEIEKQSYEAARIGDDILKAKLPAVTNEKIEARLVLRKTCGCINFKKSKTEQDYLEERKCVASKIHYRSADQLYMIHHFLLESQSPVTLEKFYGRLSHCFSAFDIRYATLVLYDKPVYSTVSSDFKIPEKASVELKYDVKEGISNPKIKFNPSEIILPKNILESISGTQIMFPVYAEKYLYGYFLMEIGQYEEMFYQTIVETISKELITSIKISKSEKEKEKLKDKNNLLEEYSDKLNILSRTDEMTLLLNRRGFYEAAQSIIDNCIMIKKKGLVIFCDMDKLKSINDTYGHEVGDKAIMAEAEILKDVFRAADVIGRIGGDEFAIVSPELSISDFPKIKKRLIEKCNEYNKKSGEQFVLSMSAGCAQFDNMQNNLDILLNFADQKLYTEKRSKKQLSQNVKK